MKWRKLLNNAWKTISAKKSDKGKYISPKYQKFADNYRTNLNSIEHHLKQKDYIFGKYKAILKPKGNGECRPIIIPISVNDQIVLKAIYDYLLDKLSKKFKRVLSISYAYQKGRSARDALIKLKEIYDYPNVLLKLDIKHFFNEIDKDILMQIISPIPIDDYVKKLILNGITPDVDYSNIQKSELDKFPKGGIPQGISISSVLSNLYLLEFDELAISNGWKIVRYADDMVFSVPNIDIAKSILSQVEQYLTNERKLRIHPLGNSSDSKTAIFQNLKKTKMKYLGVNFDGCKLLPTKKRRKLLIDRVEGILKNTSETEVQRKIDNVISQWCGYYAFTDIDDGHMGKMNKDINRLITKSNLDNVNKINLIKVMKRIRERQNNRFFKLLYSVKNEEESAWLEFYN